MMRLGAPVLTEYTDPTSWIEGIQRQRCRAAYCPVGVSANDVEVKAYAEAAIRADILIAEVGAWSNPISPDDNVRCDAIAYCQQSLDLAERIGAVCCVNIAGSRGSARNAPHPDNLTDDTFALIVETVRMIIDAVKPRHTAFVLEGMPWLFPDSVDSYVRLIQAVNRSSFGAHLDPVNWISSPQLYYSNGAMIRDAFHRLGPYIKSCHAKDIFLRNAPPVCLNEVRPGLGNLDFPTYLREIAALGRDVPLMIEHLSTNEEYLQAIEFLLGVAEREALL